LDFHEEGPQVKRLILSVVTLGVVLAGSEARAQERWAVELRVNGDVPTQDIGDDKLGTGFGSEVTLRYRFLPHLAAYAGWDWIRFTPDDSFMGSDMDFEETGYAFGLRFEHPLTGESGPAVWVRAGGTYDHVEVENADGDLLANSGHGLGWEAGAGLALGVGRSWSFTPGVRYRALSRDLKVGSVTTDTDLTYFAFEVGFARLF
jgi:hypothetical protein